MLSISLIFSHVFSWTHSSNHDTQNQHRNTQYKPRKFHVSIFLNQSSRVKIHHGKLFTFLVESKSKMIISRSNFVILVLVNDLGSLAECYGSEIAIYFNFNPIINSWEKLKSLKKLWKANESLLGLVRARDWWIVPLVGFVAKTDIFPFILQWIHSNGHN